MTNGSYGRDLTPKQLAALHNIPCKLRDVGGPESQETKEELAELGYLVLDVLAPEGCRLTAKGEMTKRLVRPVGLGC
ncbi:hypothetical protein OOZ63_02315 [Paucibacter sp. PLA-PC-4]|uniref:hypothetical protein n=1 Tax=Paucibacter sp. PLA-PC-4 TaxID=2993655 RepID=UPI00224944F6|nr:hypothetical protein [Paucibacter sp. PLA-PC-4]MCX2860666.1 hypothetical protein [Paucibacter sp. PLA-PC-4]